jgi:hypothetical protein
VPRAHGCRGGTQGGGRGRGRRATAVECDTRARRAGLVAMAVAVATPWRRSGRGKEERAGVGVWLPVELIGLGWHAPMVAELSAEVRVEVRR